MVSLDLYVNETNRHADYVLPATTWLEREDVPLAFLGFYTTPFVQYSDPVVAPAGEAREEWQIIDAIARRIGVAPYSEKRLRRLGELGLRLNAEADPRPAAAQRPRPPEHPRPEAPPARPGHVGPHRHRRAAREGPPPRRARAPGPAGDRWPSLRRLDAAVHEDDPERPLRLIGLRELRSHNSWMHNANATHARRAHARPARAPRRRRGARSGRRRRGARGQQVRRRRGAGAGDRRHDPGHGRAAARLGPSRRLVVGQRGRRRERQPALAPPSPRISSPWPAWPS